MKSLSSEFGKILPFSLPDLHYSPDNKGRLPQIVSERKESIVENTLESRLEIAV